METEELTRDLATQLQALAQKTDDRKTYTCRRRAPTRSTSRSSGPRSTSGTSCTTARTRSSPPTTTPRRHASSRSSRPYEARAKNAAGAEAAAVRRAARPLLRAQGRRGGQDHRLRGRRRAAGAEARRGEVHRQVPAQPATRSTVKFNIARAYYDDGEFERRASSSPPSPWSTRRRRTRRWRASWPWTASASSTTSRASRRPRRKFLANRSCPPTFLAEVRKFQAREQGRGAGRAGAAELGRDRRRGGGPAEGRRREQGRRHRRRRRSTARSPPRARRRTTPRSGRSARSCSPTTRRPATPRTCWPTLGRHSAEAARFPEAAQWYRAARGQRWARTAPATTAGWPRGRLRLALNDLPGARARTSSRGQRGRQAQGRGAGAARRDAS